jgi:hypothetical protein
MRLAYLFSRLDVEELSVPEVVEALSVPYKTAVRMLGRVSDVLITYKGLLDRKRFGKPVTNYIIAKARPPQPRLRFSKAEHPSNPRDKASIGRRYKRWKARLKLDPAVTPEPHGVLASFDTAPQPENLDRVERLLMLLLGADLKKVRKAGKRRQGWSLHRSRVYEARVRRPNRAASISRSLPADSTGAS